MPEGMEPPAGEMPGMPEGIEPPAGEMPTMPEGMEIPEGFFGGWGQGGEPPAGFGGEMPGNAGSVSDGEAQNIFYMQDKVNFFSGVTAMK